VVVILPASYTLVHLLNSRSKAMCSTSSKGVTARRRTPQQHHVWPPQVALLHRLYHT
jgi:hypothetical protein